METASIYYSYKAATIKVEISENDKCNFCKTKEEDYLHFFITCSFLKDFWEKVHYLLAKMNFQNKILAKHIVFGYKISDQGYNGFNYFLTIIVFVFTSRIMYPSKN